LETDPPPDLAIEIDITSTSVNKFGIYLALGVPELWRYNGRDLKFYQLAEGNMLSVSLALPFPVSVIEISRFIEQSKTIGNCLAEIISSLGGEKNSIVGRFTPQVWYLLQDALPDQMEGVCQRLRNWKMC